MGSKRQSKSPEAGSKSCKMSGLRPQAWIVPATWSFCLLVGYLHYYHVSQMFENDRHFSHLSSLEREMCFRTEMGLYYSYYKTVVQAPTFGQGIHSLIYDNRTEFPDTINTLQRFNLYPEIVLAALYRVYDQVSSTLGWSTKSCWRIDRGPHLSPVWSCVGSGEPAYFYLGGVWLCAALTTATLFLIGKELSESLLGGAISVLCFFYNHGECSRVQWTPPLRESFAFPLSLMQILVVCKILKGSVEPQSGSWKTACKQLLALSFLTTAYMSVWQFAQFSLFTQVCCLVCVFAWGKISTETFRLILVGLLIGLGMALMLLFFNKMLLTSWLFCSLMSSAAVIHVTEWLPRLGLCSPTDRLSSMGRLLRGSLLVLLFLTLTLLFKVVAGRVLGVQDDAHISNLLRAKFTSYRDFHTLLYTCAKEFDFIGWEMPAKTSMTLLLPAVGVVLVIILINVAEDQKWITFAHSDCQFPSLSPELLYTLLQLLVYGGMAVLIMRLKVFFTPHLCLTASLLASRQRIPYLRSKSGAHGACLIALLACMSVQGLANIREQHNIIGEYSNPKLEELIEWINGSVPENAALAGPMPIMANLLLSTRRPIVNHPHYEDVGQRIRTKKVYQMYSRVNQEHYYRTLVSLKVNYLVLNSGWCLHSESSSGCGMTDIWDAEEPDRVSVPPLCPKLFTESGGAIYPFVRVYSNDEYVVLKVPTAAVQLQPTYQAI